MSLPGDVAVVLLCGATVAVAPPRDWHTWARQNEGRHAYGIYMVGKKVGWAVEETKLGKHRGKPVLRSASESHLATVFDGEASVKKENSLILYELEGKGEIVFAQSTREEDGKETYRRVERKGDALEITTRQGGRTLRRSVPMPRDTLRHHSELQAWLAGPRKRGDRFTKYSAEWGDKDVDSKEVYTFKEKKKVLWSGLPTEVIECEIEADGGKMQVQMLPDATQLTGSLGALLSMRLEKEEDARRLDAKPVDLMSLTSIFVDKDLGPARGVDALTLELAGVGDFKVPASHRQAVRPGKGKGGVTTVELRRDFRVEKAEPLSKAQRKKYLEETPRIQCDHEAISDLAAKVVGKEKDALEAARKLEKWVYRNLRKSYSSNADTALEILDNKAGDCTEHTLLYVSLARAAGLPAREVSGLAYVPGDKPLFGWHAWAEVHDGHQWVSVDPTWDQVYVDGTHLKMAEGDKDMAWANVAGKLKIKILEAKRHGGR